MVTRGGQDSVHPEVAGYIRSQVSMPPLSNIKSSIEIGMLLRDRYHEWPLSNLERPKTSFTSAMTLVLPATFGCCHSHFWQVSMTLCRPQKPYTT